MVRYTGEGKSDNGDTFLIAKDGDRRIVVHISGEAIERFGLRVCKDKGIEKYDAAPADRLQVLTSDFAGTVGLAID